MKSTYFIIALMAIALNSCTPTHVIVQTPPPPPPQQPVNPEPISYQVFYDDLSPYGQWINYPGYGYVWMPDAGPDFKPYSTNGHWVYSNEGWIWASDYEWGWAVFHYGNWFFDQNYGWMWIPGTQWAPAWVNWRQNSDYYGWAPLGPNISEGMYASYNPPSNYWSFVPHQYVNNPHVNNYTVTEVNNVTIINRTTVINNTVINNTQVNNYTSSHNYISGPDVNEVSRATGTTIRPIAIQTSSHAGQTQMNNGQLTIFRPKINGGSSGTGATNDNQQKPAPKQVQSLNNLSKRQVTNNNNPHPPAQENSGNAAQRSEEPAKNNPPTAAKNEKPTNNLPPNNTGTGIQVGRSVTPSSNEQTGTKQPNTPVSNRNTTTPAPSNLPANSANGNKKPENTQTQQNKINPDTAQQKQNKPPVKPAQKPKPKPKPATDKDNDKAKPGQ